MHAKIQNVHAQNVTAREAKPVHAVNANALARANVIAKNAIAVA